MACHKSFLRLRSDQADFNICLSEYGDSADSLQNSLDLSHPGFSLHVQGNQSMFILLAPYTLFTRVKFMSLRLWRSMNLAHSGERQGLEKNTTAHEHGSSDMPKGHPTVTSGNR